jgi:hypothetical protein
MEPAQKRGDNVLTALLSALALSYRQRLTIGAIDRYWLYL